MDEAGHGARTRIIVVSDHDESTIADCLDALTEDGGEHCEVVVVDLDSADRSADVAIHHPLPRRVAVVPRGDRDRVVDASGPGADGARILLLPADRRPQPGWLDAALRALERHALVWGPDQSPDHLAVDRRSYPHVSLTSDDACTTTHRFVLAGASVGTAPSMQIEQATARAPELTRLPVTAPPPAGPAYQGLVTVAVCTRGRPDHLARCLASLARLEDPDHEIVVIDNHDHPAVDQATLPARGRLVHEPRRGLDRARNRALSEARGGVVAFVDDDCEVDAHWLAGIRRGFAGRDVVAVTGRVRAASLAAPSQRWFEFRFGFDRGTRHQHFHRDDRRAWFPLWSGGIGTGCNLAVRRSAADEIGRFDELLDMGTRIGGGGDLDLLNRLIDSGAVVAYQADALVWHHHRATETAATRQFFGYGASVGALLTKAVLERPGQRMIALRFFADRVLDTVRQVRRSRAGSHLVPARLLLVELVGQLVGPFLYLGGRAGSTGRG